MAGSPPRGYSGDRFEAIAADLVKCDPFDPADPLPWRLALVRCGIDGLRGRERRILRDRILRPGPSAPTLAHLGGELGVSRTRVGHLQRHAVGRLDPDGSLARVADARLAACLERTRAPLSVSALEAADGWFRGVAAHPHVFRRLLKALGCRHAVLWDQDRPEAFVAAL